MIWVKKIKTDEHIGSEVSANIKSYILSRAKLLITVWDEIPCTRHYHLNTYEGQPCPEGYQATFQTPSYVYTNGTAFFQQPYDTYSGMQNNLHCITNLLYLHSK